MNRKKAGPRKGTEASTKTALLKQRDSLPILDLVHFWTNDKGEAALLQSGIAQSILKGELDEVASPDGPVPGFLVMDPETGRTWSGDGKALARKYMDGTALVSLPEFIAMGFLGLTQAGVWQYCAQSKIAPPAFWRCKRPQSVAKAEDKIASASNRGRPADRRTPLQEWMVSLQAADRALPDTRLAALFVLETHAPKSSEDAVRKAIGRLRRSTKKA